MIGSINDPTQPQTAVRFPAVRLLTSGQPVAGVKTVSVTNNNYYQADRFHCTVVFSAHLSGQQPDANWFSQQTDIDVQFDMAVSGSASDTPLWTPVLSGMVDRLTIDPIMGTVELEGRDYTGLLIDAKIQDAYKNQTSSQIVQAIIGNHPQIAAGNIVATSTPVGKYYQIDHDRIQLNNFSKQTTEWDLITYLAGVEGYDVFMTGNALNFQPSQQEGDTPPFIIQLTPGAGAGPSRLNVLTCNMQRALTLAKDIEVTVKTWNSKQKNSFTKTVRGATQGSTGTSASKTDVTKYVFVKPNMTPDEALQFAQQKLKELSQNERVLEITTPSPLALTPRDIINLTGTGTSFDQLYFIAEIERSLDFAGGFHQHIRAKNTSPRTTTTVS
jgi:hypothetical protein